MINNATIEFQSLTPDQNFAFVDVTSISELMKHRDFLGTPIRTEPVYMAMRTEFRNRPAIRHAVKLLSRMIAYDTLVIDHVAASSLNGELPSQPLPIRTVEFPQSVYNSAAYQTHMIADNPLYKNLEKEIQQRDDLPTTSDYENYHDTLFQQSALAISTLADTGPTLPRLLFYITLAGLLNAPLFLSPSKDQLLDQLAERQRTILIDCLQMVQDESDKILLESMHELVSSELLLPRLEEFIFLTARREKISLIQAMIEVKNTRNATVFRQWLHSIHRCLAEATAKGALEAKRQFVELQNAVKGWVSEEGEIDIGRGVTHERTKLPIGIATDMLKEHFGVTIPLPTFVVKDPILNQKRQFSFIASWYSHAG